jgi:hypothetical protein
MTRVIREAVAVFGLRAVVLELAVGSTAYLSLAAFVWAVAVVGGGA